MCNLLFRNRVIASGSVALLFFLVAACMKTTTTVPVVNSSSSMDKIIKSATNLTILDSILSKTGYSYVLDSASPQPSVGAPYTLFAAPDIAYTGAGINDSVVNAIPTAILKKIFLYSLVSGQGLTSANLPTGPNAKYVTAGGDSIFITVNTSGIYINGNPITQPDVIASNGVIQAVSRVLLPPTGSIYQTLQQDTTLTFLVEALNRSGTNLDSLLSNGGVFTIFAPTNSAFYAYYNDSTTNTIDAKSPDSLSILLQRHILNGRVFSSDFVPGGSIPTLLAGDSVNFYSTVNANTIVQKGDTTFSTIQAINIMGYNGVIHKISNVLVP